MSTNFTDREGQVWTLRMDWAAMRRSAAAGVDLSAFEEHLADFHRGSHKLIDALWAVVRSDSPLVPTIEEFEARVQGDAMPGALEALTAAVVEFYPESRAALIRAADDEIRRELVQLREKFVEQSTA